MASVATVDLAPFWIALEGGYFTAEGLTVREAPAPKTEVALTKVLSGEVDVGLTTYTAIFGAAAKDIAELRLVADASSASPESNEIVTVPNSSVKTVHDLAGKRIAVSSVTQASGVLTKSVMRDHNVDFTKVKWMEMPLPNVANALQQGQVDAGYQPEPFLKQAAIEVGAIPVIDAASGQTQNMPIAGYAALGKWVQENPKTMQAFQRAMLRATHDATADRSKVERVVVTHAKVKEGIASLMKLPDFQPRLDARRIQRVPDLLKALGVIDRTVDAAPMIVPQVAG